MLRLSHLLAIVPVAALAACNPYDPDLGPNPFKCGSTEPKCPDNYECGADNICRQSEGIDGSTSAFQCANDMTVEGATRNDDFQHAFVTPIPGMANYALVGLALCPDGDKDHYQFNVNQTGVNLDVTVSAQAGRTAPSVNLLSNTGMLIASGAPSATSAQVVNLQVTNRLAVGSGPYYIQVQSPDMSENNYDLSIRTCTTPIPCPAN